MDGHGNTATLLEKPMFLLEPFSGFLLLESVEPDGRYDVGGEGGNIEIGVMFYGKIGMG